MLILSRRCGESFMIGDDIKVTVLASKGNQIRLGTDAPRTLPVHREEIFQRLQQAREAEKQSELKTSRPKAVELLEEN